MMAIKNIWIRSISQQVVSRAKASQKVIDYRKVNFAPGRELYNPGLILKNFGIIPLLIVIGGGLCALTAFVIRTSVTRDDVRYRTRGKFGYEEEANFDRKRKFLVFNQKYKCPDGLKELYEIFKQEKK